VPESRTVLQACVAAKGVHRGALAAAHVAQWAMTTHELGRIPTVVEYAEWWAVKERTGWRHRADCRDVFGESWREVVLSLAAEIGRRKVRSTGRAVGLSVAVAA
jgi:hypothetical protein